MRRASVVNGVKNTAAPASSPDSRVELALALGRRDLALHAAQAGVSLAEARRAVERRRQARRRPSKVLLSLLA
jgi:NACalpha-BTF3-like transcription factor